MLETLITSKTRLKLLLKFFLNSNSSSYLRNLENEFGNSSNSIRIELNRFEQAGLLKSENIGNRKYYQANTNHPLFPSIHNLIIQQIGFDKIIETVIEKLGKLKCCYVVGDFARGIDNKRIEIIFVGDRIKQDYLISLIKKAEILIKRSIHFEVYNDKELKKSNIFEKGTPSLLLWKE
ncbi:MAG: ArsR family transcriptional regulator [Bacteroidales bacterium]|nr:ArsR family transcriptional regulator [Bacteroidales bacterium]